MTKLVTPTLSICLVGAALMGFGLGRPAAEDAVPLPPGGYAVEAKAPLRADDPYGEDSGGADPYGNDAEAADGSTGEPGGIKIVNFDFEGTLTVAPGDVLVVTNFDTAPHTVTSNDGLFDTGTLQQGESTTIVVPQNPGQYAFFCSVPPSMTGTLIVQTS